MAENNDLFQNCKEFVERIQKIVILCPVPFVIMIILDGDDIQSCLIVMTALILTLLVVAHLSNERQNVVKGVEKVKVHRL